MIRMFEVFLNELLFKAKPIVFRYLSICKLLIVTNGGSALLCNSNKIRDNDHNSTDQIWTSIPISIGSINYWLTILAQNL